MARNLILSGGVAHDYEKTSPMLARILDEVGIESEIHETFDVVEGGGLADFDMLTLNCARWTCSQTPAWRDEWHFELSEAARKGFLEFLGQGNGLLALHCATLCFDDWPESRNILGAWWEWEVSGHAPFQEQPMRVRIDAHAIVKGVEDFTILDELYTNPQITDTVDPLIEADWEGKAHPMLWVRKYGKARICYNALGHGVEAFANPALQTLLKRGAQWVLGQL